MIRRMEQQDISRVAEIHVFGWRHTYRGIVNDSILFNKMLVAKRIMYFKKALSEGLEETYVYDDGMIKAILTIGKSRDLDKEYAFELWGLYVDPFMQGEGIGKKLLAFCEEKGKERGYKEMILWVLEKNNKGRNFYEKQGYRLEGRKQEIEPLNVTEIRYIKAI